MNPNPGLLTRLYRHYDFICVTSEQLWYYMLPLRVLSQCLGADVITLMVVWLSTVDEEAIVLSALTYQPWFEGYVLPLSQDLEFAWAYGVQMAEFGLWDFGNWLRELAVSGYYRVAQITASVIGALQ